MGFDEFIQGLSNDELRTIAEAVANNELDPALELRLFELLDEQTTIDEREAAIDDRPAFFELGVPLGLSFEEVQPGEPPEGAEPTEPEPDVTIEEVEEPEPTRRQPTREPPELSPDEAAQRRGAVRPDPGERIRRDTSRISGESVRRDIGLEFLFFDLLRDLGRCDQFPCGNPDNYFRLTPSEQRKFFDFTLEDALLWLVRRGEVTPSTLRNRGFPEDVIPDEDEGGMPAR